MRSNDELAEIGQLVSDRLRDAVATQPPTRRQNATARSDDGDVTVTVDARGFLAHVQFGSGMAELTAEELERELLDTLRSAQQALVPARPAGSAAAALHDDTVARRLREVFERRMREAKGDEA
ncbi:hypothetical protein [Microbacterium sp. Marseille-Q6965]|uniref:hypothetical protein n=1 Tax=Microbacterium sp. Marseille-Q6965 TaxID=2965072 RepID=UPI0021B6FD30|nr:hypothetical protein [Microbacterium sp. Marseille-Q6965]